MQDKLLREYLGLEPSGSWLYPTENKRMRLIFDSIDLINYSKKNIDILDQKLNIILNHLGLDINKIPDIKTIYKVTEKED